MTFRTIMATLLLGATGTLASCSEGNTTNTTSTCGDAARSGAEACDGADFGGKTCESFGFGAGTLSCASDCTSIVTSQCGAPATCGNGKKDTIETCDGTDLGGQTCMGLELGMGNLGCQLNCLGFDTAGCSGPATCGNGKKDGTEVCDGKDLGGATCESAGAGTGTLACANNCIAFDTAGCVCAPACGTLECGPDPQCGQSCGECTVGAMCDAGKCIEICDLPRLTQSKTLDLDIKTATITGTVTLNGATMPNDNITDGKTRGTLIFRDTITGEEYNVDLGETGAANYSMKLFASTYDVFIYGNYGTMQSVLPGNRKMKLSSALAIDANTTLNWDAKTLQLSGKVTLNGSAMPTDAIADGQTRGRLRLRNVDTLTDDDFDFKEMGPVSYSTTLFAGTYDVYIHGNYEANQSVLPGNRDMLVQKNLVLDTTTTKDFDAKTLTLSGKVTLNGAPMPSDTITDGKTRGKIRFRNAEVLDEYEVDFAEAGPVTYTRTMFAGLYDVFIHGNYETMQSVLPGNRDMLVQRNVPFTTTMAKDFDAKTLTLSGKVTLNGAPLPTDGILDGKTRGSLIFRNLDTFDESEVDFGEMGPITYSRKLFAGLYDVYVHSNYDTQQTVFPGNRGMMIERNLALTANATKDFDALTITLSGAVTLNGATMPDDTKIDTQARGLLRFRNVELAEDYDINLGEKGAVMYSQKMFAGLYDVIIHGNFETVQSVLPGDRNMAVERALLRMTTTKNIDAKTVTLTGKVTLNGAAMPSDTITDGQHRGLLRFFNLETWEDNDLSLGEAGAVTYTQKLFAGAYDVLVASGSATTQSVFPGVKKGRILKGCTTR